MLIRAHVSNGGVFTFTAFLLMFAMLYLGQGTVQAQESAVLSRSVGIKDTNTSPDGAIALLLHAGGVPGGIISLYDRCLQPSPQRFFLQGFTLQQGLDSIASIDASRKWAYRNGAILVGQQLQTRTILSAILDDVEFRPSDALTLSTQRLLETGEVRGRIRALKFDEGMNPVIISGFYAISRTGNRDQTLPPVPPIHLHQVTLSDSLNSVAAINGKAVWLYEQFECGGKATFRITWVVK